MQNNDKDKIIFANPVEAPFVVNPFPKVRDNIYTEQEARTKIINGIKKTCSLIKGAYGAAGGNAIVESDLYPYHIITNDGKSIVEKVKLIDPLENIGANIVKEVGDKADKDSGDGRKTTMILTEAILTEVEKVQGTPLEIKKSLDECLPIILKSIDEQKKEIGIEEVGKVAAISAESEEIGNKIQEIYAEIGKDGIIELDNSNTFETYFEVKEGVRLRNTGYITPYMATEGEKAIYSKPKVLITKQKLSAVSDLNPIFEQLTKEGTNELVIMCDDIDTNLLGFLAITHMRGIFKTLVIKAPTLWKDWVFEDFAKITGANIVSPETGITLKTVTTKDLGTCEKIISSREETTVLGIKDISEHLKDLEEKSKTNDQLKIRISWLNTKAAVLKIGANSESELAYKSKKAKDAVAASYLALQDGVVAGGGVTLLKAVIDLNPAKIGDRILLEALQAPYNQLCENMGIEKGIEFTGVMDAALVVKNAIKNAISIAGTVLTAKVAVTIPKIQTNENTRQMPIM